MDFLISASSDIGIKKKTNQDSLCVKKINTPAGIMVFAILCDGMGGLEKGEVASATVIDYFGKWVQSELIKIVALPNFDQEISKQWTDLAKAMNEKIKIYGKKSGVNLGTTLTAMLLCQEKYYIVNVGDTRAYEISNQVVALTKDHSVVAKAVENGEITEEQAKFDPRRSVLIQCVGASEEIYPDVFIGQIKSNCVYMICSDGFRHELTEREIYSCLNPEKMTQVEAMKYYTDYLIDVNKKRNETDNISVITIKTV